MPDHSPATRAIVQAFDARYELCGPFDDNWQELCLAAALRAAADQVAPQTNYPIDSPWGVGFADRDAQLRRDLLAIAAELEGGHG